MTADTMFFHGPNAGYVLEQFERYQQDPAQIEDADLRAYFDRLVPFSATAAAATNGAAAATNGKPAPAAATLLAPVLDVNKVVAAARIARLVREMGHLAARLDPLGSEPPGDPSLELATHGLTTEDLAALPASVAGGPLADGASSALDVLGKLRQAYSGAVGYEDDHIHIPQERDWLRHAAETGRFFQNFDAGEKRDLLERLSEVETFERFLHNTPPFANQKRFSIEGCDMMVPILDAIIRCTAKAGTREVAIGMAHRGRLNVLAHVLGKPYAAILSEFPNPNSAGEKPAESGTGSLGYSGDVKYHLGHRRVYIESDVKEMPITLAPNPSHLEFVNPVVVGRARAAQEKRDRPGTPLQDPKASLAILIHGDAAFPGQGVVAETLNLSQLPGYAVGGTIHIIANNQIGFTTTPKDGRSTMYASDLAKGFEIPIVHVNADDPHACIAVARMACAYRERFGKDFLIDLIGYRRWGHNEGDQPAFTQPRMYETIRAHPTVRELWAKTLENERIVTSDEATAFVARVQQRLAEAKTKGVATPLPAPAVALPDAATNGTAGNGTGEKNAPEPQSAATATAVSAERLRALNDALLARAEGFTVDATLEKRFLAPRKTALDTPAENNINWAHAEALAFASLLEDGTPIRLTGQDSERGTFGQRNLVLHDPTSGARFCAMQTLPQARAAFALHNSALSEIAAVGFEYGYSVHAAETLVLWEAQYGDFVNGAQVIIDQFVVSAQSKWRQTPSLVLLLPHGYEGNGPEHSSARPERFLQLCAGDNLRVANCSTPAQYFHLLRRQAALLNTDPRPLVILTPKSLLRHPRAVSSLNDLTEGAFQSVLDDPRSSTQNDSDWSANVTRLVLCSGKVYVELAGLPNFDKAEAVAVARIEELNPFPAGEVARLLMRYPALREVVWLQEEPQNMGAWTFMQPRLASLMGDRITLRYVGRAEAASPAEGSLGRHAAEQNRLLSAALAPAPERVVGAEPGVTTEVSATLHAKPAPRTQSKVSKTNGR